MGKKCSTYERGACRVLIRKHEERKPLGRSRRRREEKVKMVLRDVGCEGMDWIDVAQGRDKWQAIVNAVMNIRFP
jgi:transposase